MLNAGKYIFKALIALALLTNACWTQAAYAQHRPALPLQPGEYYFQAADDCGGPAALSWDGKRFLADYVYIDNIIKVRKAGANRFDVISRTKTRDENTRMSGRVWRARVVVLGKSKFSFNQYSNREKFDPKNDRIYLKCKH